MALAFVHLPIGDQALAVGVHTGKSSGNLAGGEGSVPYAHLTQATLEELARAVIAPRHAQLEALEGCGLARAAGLGILYAIDIHLEGGAVIGAGNEVPSVGLEMSRREASAARQNPLQDVTTRRTVLTEAEHVGFLLILALNGEDALDITHVAELVGIDLELDGIVGEVHHLIVREDVVGRGILVVLKRIERDDARNLQEDSTATLNDLAAVARHLPDGHRDNVCGPLNKAIGIDDLDLGCCGQSLALRNSHLAVL